MAGAPHRPVSARTLRPAGAEDESRLVDALCARDEAAFALLLDTYHNALVRLAMVYVTDRSVAEEVAQETWLAVLEGITRFEGRSSLKTWLFRILVNRARTRAVREGRSIAFSALTSPTDAAYEPSVDPDRFNSADHPRWPGHWCAPPADWDDTPERQLLARETLACIDNCISGLPPVQQEVITLRDIEGLSSGEVCNVLGITETNQRVLLHRARSKVRLALERYLKHD